jgi:hypothetical protein
MSSNDPDTRLSRLVAELSTADPSLPGATSRRVLGGSAMGEPGNVAVMGVAPGLGMSLIDNVETAMNYDVSDDADFSSVDFVAKSHENLGGNSISSVVNYQGSSNNFSAIGGLKPAKSDAKSGEGDSKLGDKLSFFKDSGMKAANSSSGMFDINAADITTSISNAEVFSKSMGYSRPLLSPNNKYQIICTPIGSPFLTMCRGVVGQGSAFCIRMDCDTRSHKGNKAAVYPNFLYVAKQNGTAFLEPSAPMDKIDAGYYSELKVAKLSLADWVQKLAIINKIDTKASVEKVDIEEFYVKRAKDHQTPLKSSLKERERLNYIEITPYKRQMSDISTEHIGLEINSNMVIDVLKPMDEGLHDTSKNLVKLIGMYDESVVELSAVSTKVDGLLDTVGNRISEIKEEFQAPTLWGTVAVLAANIHKIGEMYTDLEPTLISMQHKVTKLSIDTRSQGLSQNDNAALGIRIDQLRDTLYRGLESLASKAKRSERTMDLLSDEFEGFRNVRGRFVPSTSTGGSMFDIQEVKAEVERITRANDDLNIKMNNLVAQADKEAIKFCNLGFRTFQDSSAWVDIHFPDYSFGLIMSMFTVLEHVHSSFSGQPSLERLNQLYKLKIDNLNEGLAMASFDSRWPKYFMKTQSVSPITIDQSFFDRIPTHDVWDERHTGFRDRLKEEIESFRQGYERMAMNTLEPGTQPYTVAFLSVTTSIAFLDGLINFVDDIYKELTHAKFSKTKAWALVTRLIRRIFMDVGAPRMSVQNQFRTGQPEVICKQIFWAELQSLEIMNQFKAQAFKDHPAIASEYVKFLVTNTGIDSLERLFKRVDTFDEQIKEIQKGVKAATTAATTASNKVDELKKSNTELARRIAALERPR